jgi:hypothetical protein
MFSGLAQLNLKTAVSNRTGLKVETQGIEQQKSATI